MEICLYQGTFNPPHFGHLQVAEFVLKQFHFNKILFIPAANPPHKDLKESKQEALHRLEMTKLLISKNKDFQISDIEYRREAPSYTYITVKELYKELKLTTQPFFIIGDDAFIKIKSWYQSDKLKKLVKFIVLPRNNEYDKELFDKISKDGYNYTRIQMPKIPISSTQIRQLVKNKKELDNYTTKEVEKYIYEHQLYQNVN